MLSCLHRVSTIVAIALLVARTLKRQVKLKIISGGTFRERIFSKPKDHVCRVVEKQLEALKRVIFHLDMDAFYASVEQRDNPDLKGKAVIVGGSPQGRGVVCAASYEARKFGVRSAIPSATAGRLCPHGVFIRPRMDVYREESRRIMEILRATGGEIQQVSVDEAYLEFTRVFDGDSWKGSHDELLEAAVPLAREMKERIKSERKLTASIGVASNKFLAKLASDYQKPDGLTVIAEEGKDIFLRPLPVRRIHGVGAATEKVLHDASIFTMGDLQSYAGNLRAIVGSFSEQLRNFAFGIDERPLHIGDDIKSISSEETFQRDTTDRPFLRNCLWTQAEEIAAKLIRKRLFAQTVQVKVRYKDFTTLTRQLTLEDPVQDARTIYRLGCHLLARHRLIKRPIRLLGLGVSSLDAAGAVQLKLF